MNVFPIKKIVKKVKHAFSSRKKEKSWGTIHPELRQFITDQKNHNTNNPYVKKYYDFVRNCNVKSVNTYINKNISHMIPELKLTEKFITQSNYAANEVTKYAGKPTEISGVCTGREMPSGMYLDEFIPFHDQVCSPTRTKASGKGMTQTYWSLHKRNKKGLAQAHSHNTMSTFHSSTDNELLRQGVTESHMTISSKVGNLEISIPCFYNVVFNQYTTTESNKRDEPDVRTSVRMPYLTLDGKIKHCEEIHIFEPRWKIIEYKRLNEEDKQRLKAQIKERVKTTN